jgi:hypothetical protein
MSLLLETKGKTSAEPILQLFITLFAMYVVNNIILDVWRSITGH